MNPTTYSTVMDAESDDDEALVTIQRHPIDMHVLTEDVGHRVVATLNRNPAGCFYFNPAVTVSCSIPTADFFCILRKEQAKWCRQASKTFPRNVRRTASKWVGGGEWINHKYARFLDRALCFTGILFIDGQLIPSHAWAKFSEVANGRHTSTCAHYR